MVTFLRRIRFWAASWGDRVTAKDYEEIYNDSAWSDFMDGYQR